MIQRLQSVFLLLAAVCFGLEFKLPFASSNQAAEGLFSDQVYDISDHIVLQGLTIIGTVLCLGLILLYRNRALQRRLSYLAITVAIILPVIAILIYSNQTAQLSDIEIYDQAGLYLPLGMVVFIALALRFIKKDDRLVRSMDRLR